MRKTKINCELARFVINHGTDKVMNLSMGDYCYDYREDLPLTYASVEKEVIKFSKTTFGSEAIRNMAKDYQHVKSWPKRKEVVIGIMVGQEIEQMVDDVARYLLSLY